MMSWHRDGHNSCHIARCSFSARLARSACCIDAGSQFFSQPPPICREEKSWSRTGIGICCVSGCAVILVLQPGSPSKRTDENGYPTSCQDGSTRKGLSIKTVALQRGEDAGTRPSDLFAFAYDHCEDHPSWLAHAPSFFFFASDRN